VTARLLLARVRSCMDRCTTLEGLHRLALLKYRLVVML